MPKQSAIWDYFTVSTTDQAKAECNACHMKVSRGGKTPRDFSPTNLKNHLQRLHGDLYTEFCVKLKKEKDAREKRQSEEASTSSSAKRVHKQQTLPDAVSQSQKWQSNDQRQLDINKLLGEMIALDLQPFSIVEDVGFQRLVTKLAPRGYTIPSRTHLSRTVIPDINKSVKKKIGVLVDNQDYISFTTDIWTSVGSHSLMSLTAHWIDKDFMRVQAVLNASSFPVSHTGDAINDEIKAMLTDWKIGSEKVHLFVADNAANVKSGLQKAEVKHLGCFAHTLQLVINDAVLSQRTVVDMLALSRRIVGHFKHSTQAITKLKLLQQENNLPVQKLKQDVPTRWNSQMYMLQRLLEQKRAVTSYASDYGTIPTLSANQWRLAEALINVLTPFEKATRQASKKEESASMIIPRVLLLQGKLDKVDARGVGTTIDEIKASIARRFSALENNVDLVLATLLDPRFKDSFFLKEETKTKLEEWISAAYRKIAADNTGTGSSTDEGESAASGAEEETTMEEGDSDDEDFAAILNASAATQQTPPTGMTIIQEYALYRGEAHAGRNSDQLAWWKVNSTKYPKLAKMARKFLSPPPTSVPSERLFSEAEGIYDARRSCLAPEKAEMLLFIRGNLPILKFQY